MRIKRNPVEIKWKPEVYNKLSFAQNIAVQNLLEVLKIEEDANILDVGCGDGKVSAELSKIAERGSVLGLDISSEMIDFAVNNYEKTSYPNLRFLIQDAQALDFNGTFNLIFSSFALQWIEDKNLFFKKAHKALSIHGEIAIVAPLGISPELEYATKIVTESPSWSQFYKNFYPSWHFSESDEIKHLMEENCFDVTYSFTYIQNVSFPSLEDFKQYILLWFPYLAPLSENLKPVFFSQIIDEYCKILSPEQDGTILMRIPIIALIASKISL